MSYEELICQFKRKGKTTFEEYLQIGDCIKCGIGSCPENYIMDYLNMPQECCTASQFYKLIFQ